MNPWSEYLQEASDRQPARVCTPLSNHSLNADSRCAPTNHQRPLPCPASNTGHRASPPLRPFRPPFRPLTTTTPASHTTVQKPRESPATKRRGRATWSMLGTENSKRWSTSGPRETNLGTGRVDVHQRIHWPPQRSLTSRGLSPETVFRVATNFGERSSFSGWRRW